MKFLVPIDFSEQSLIAFEQACSLAESYVADICIIYIIESTGSISKILSEHSHTEESKEIENKLQHLIEKTQKKTNLKIETYIEQGSVSDVVIEKAKKVNANMIIMGTGGTEGHITKKIMGTNATKIVKQAFCPVITIHGKYHRKGYKNIVLPLDLTKTSTQKTALAIEMANVFKGAMIRIVSVLLTTDNLVVNRLIKQIIKVKENFDNLGINCTAELVKIVKGEETFSQTIIDYANKVEGDLIIIMTQQEKEIKEFFLGSAAREIINYSDIPVMSIVPKSNN